jgi:hypothetical protein
MMKRRLIVITVALFALVAFVGFNLLTPAQREHKQPTIVFMPRR